MRTCEFSWSLAVIACLGIAASARGAAAPDESAAGAKPIHASKIILVGDSTVSVQSGWGGSFCSEHVTSFVACVNLARPGRSSSSYRAEGSWELALAEARAPGFENNWILIQFGHNDQPGKPGRSTDLATEFPANLRRYVSEAREAGARPILVTPLARRLFKDGKLQNGLRPWAEAAIGVARDMNVPLIDLNADSSEALQSMGLADANELAQAPPPGEVAAAAHTSPDGEKTGQPKRSFDYTHLGRKGSDYFAAMVSKELANKVPEMRGLLIP